MNKFPFIKTFLFSTVFLVSCTNSNAPETTKGESPAATAGVLIALPFTNKTEAGTISEENGPYYTTVNDDLILCQNGALPYYISCNDTGRNERSFYSNGKIMAEGKYKNEKRTGPWCSYYNNADSTTLKQTGRISATGIFANGFPIGKWIFYYSNGNKKAEGEFAKGKFELGCAGSNNFIPISIQNGKWDFWFEDGSKNVSCTFKANESGQECLNGIYTEWYKNGNKKREGNFRNNSKTNKWTFWYENGNKKREEFYKYKDCGLEDYVSYECPAGTWTSWNKDGSILKTEKYFNGQKQE